MRTHDLLNGGSVRRLRELRARVERHNAKHGGDKPGHTIDWRTGRGWIGRINGDAHGPRFHDDGRAASLPLSVMDGSRDVGKAHDIVRLGHTGWFTDAYMSETMCGHVWQLPARNGEAVYLAGYADKNAGYATLCAARGNLETFAEKEDAARAADSLCESIAEREREYNEKRHAAREADEAADDKKDEMRAIRKDVRTCAATIRALRKAGESILAVTHVERLDALRDDHDEALRVLIEKRAIVAGYAAEGIEA